MNLWFLINRIANHSVLCYNHYDIRDVQNAGNIKLKVHLAKVHRGNLNL